MKFNWNEELREAIARSPAINAPPRYCGHCRQYLPRGYTHTIHNGECEVIANEEWWRRWGELILGIRRVNEQ